MFQAMHRVTKYTVTRNAVCN